MVGWILVFTTRLVIPLVILKRPFLGCLLALIVDAVDIYLFTTLGGGISSVAYNMTDKAFDMYALTLMAFVIFRSRHQIDARVAIGLYFFRLVGFIAYEIIKAREILFIFPNVFGLFALVYFALGGSENKFLKKNKNLVITLMVLTTFKLAQEYLLHVIEFPFYVTITSLLGL